MGVIKNHTTVIDDKSYSCKTFPASEGLVLLPKLLSLIGEDVTNLLFSTTDGQLEDLFSDQKVISALLIKVAERAAEDDGLLHLKELLKYTECEEVQVGEALIPASVYNRFDTHFAGDYVHLFKVVGWVARTSFGKP